MRMMAAIGFSRFDVRKRLFTLMTILIIVVTVDSNIGYVADFIHKQLSSNNGIIVFIALSGLFIITQYLVLAYVRQANKEMRQRVPHLRTLHTGVSVAQYGTGGISIICNFASSNVATIQHYNNLHCLFH